jgi:hypothetical protein
MKIRITGAKKSSYWYADKIGEVFETDGVIEGGVRYVLDDGMRGVQLTDCEVVTEPTEAITLLPDESLGGLLREYNEVKRKARVGERVKVVASDRADNGVAGSVGVCTRIGQFRDDSIDTTLTHDEDGFIDVDHAQYVVLEASDILRVDNERLRMVERKAAVGERVVITKVEEGYEFFSRGDVGRAVNVVGDFYVEFGNNSYYVGPHNGSSEYRVLEPLTDAIPTQLSTLDPVDQYAENIAKLTAKINVLETQLRVAREDIVLVEEGVAGEIDALKKRMATLESARKTEVYADINAQIKQAASERKKTPQQIRDEIVARAKADVAAVIKDTFEGDDFLNGRFPSIKRMGHVRIEFVVNRDKRTVTALGYLRYSKKHPPVVVGRAICAPSEVFNVHIGKAIALHRALGLEVPAEYMNVPAPTEVRVGDIVLCHGIDNNISVTGTLTTRAERHDGTSYGNSAFFWDRGGWIADKQYRVIDDSREELEGVTA